MTALPRSMKPDPDRNARTAVSRAGRRKEQEVVKPFAFYGRVSTEDQQAPASSRAWQLRRSLQLIQPRGGEIVAVGTPEDIVKVEASHTGHYLKDLLRPRKMAAE